MRAGRKVQVLPWRGYMTQQLPSAHIYRVPVAVPAPNVLVADVFGTGIFTDIPRHKTGTSFVPYTPFLRLSRFLTR